MVLLLKVSRTEAKRSKGRYNMSRMSSVSAEKRSVSNRSEDLDMFDLFDGSDDRETSRRASDDAEEMDLGIKIGAKSCHSLKSKNLVVLLCE